MFRKYAWLPLLLAILMLLSACGPKEAAVTPTPQPTPIQPTPTPMPTPTPTPEPTPSPTPTPGPISDPVCLLRGEKIVSLCDTAFFYDAMLTADGKLLAWGEIPFDLERCVLRQDDSGYEIYELPAENITGAWLGRTSILALDKDGVLWGSGGGYGQLWDAPQVDDGWTRMRKLTDHVVSASIEGWEYSAAVKDDGGVWLMGRPISGNENLPPTQIAKIKGAAEIYGDPSAYQGGYLYVRDKDGVSWRLGKVKELLGDPTAVTLEPYPGIKWLDEDLWLTDEGELVRGLPDGGEQVLLTNVADVDLTYEVHATAVTKDGDLYVWNEWSPEGEYWGPLIVDSPTKVMEGVKLAGTRWSGITVVLEEDGSVWSIDADALNAALANNELLVLPG